MAIQRDLSTTRKVALLIIATALLPGVTAPAATAKKKPAPKPAVAKPSVIDPVLARALKSAPSADKYPNSDSAALLDLGTITVRADGTVVAEYRETYKLFNERARHRAEVSFDFNSSYEDMEVLQARTIAKSGQVLDVKPSEIRVTSNYGEFALYDDSKSLGFSLPGIEDDCVIDYTYRKTSRPMLPGHFREYWSFQGFDPSTISRLVLTAPADKKVEYKVRNNDSLKPATVASKDNKTKTYTWEMTNLAPLESEPDMPSLNEVGIWMEVTSGNSWQDIAKWFWGLAKPQLTPNEAIRATVHKLIADKKTEEEKARALYDYVANRVRYVGVEFGISAYRPHAAAQVHEKLYGDCKDKASLLITMLGVAGIKAHPVLLYAGEKRKVSTELPSLSAFDHCIALTEVNGKPVWLDATAESVAYGDIPAGDRGAEAFVVRDGIGKFETIPNYQPDENHTHADMDIALRPDGGADLEIAITFRGMLEQSMRGSLRSMQPKDMKEMMQSMAQAFSPGGTLKDYKLPDPNTKGGPWVLRINVSAPNWAKKTGRLLLVPLNSGSGRFMGRTPYVKDTRVWPIVNRESLSISYDLKVALPEGYVVEEMPGEITVSNPLYEFKRQVTKSADGQSVGTKGNVTVREGRLPASEYGKVKGFFDTINKANEDLLVLRRN